MIIDGHSHACGYFNTIELIRKNMLKNNLDKIVLFPGEPDKKVDIIKERKNKEILYFTNIIGSFLANFMKIESVIQKRNNDIFEMRKLEPNKIIQFYWITPNNLNALNEDFSKFKFSGLKLHQCVKYFSIKSIFFNTVLNFAEQQKLPIVIHLRAKKDVLNLIDLVKNRNVTVIIAHLFYIDEFKTAWEDISNNIWFDMANYYFINEATIYRALEYFGAGKIIFGSDNPFGENCISKTINLVKKLKISESEKKLILGGNMEKILNL